VIAELLPASVITVSVDPAAVTEGELMAAELAAIERAVPKRRREFAAGRHCSRLALARLGIEGFPILPGPRREPLWPSGIVGSITHCDSFAAASVARAGELRSIGVDAEPAGPLPEGVGPIVCSPDELRWVARRAGDGVAWDKLVFSAKESVYKAWFPLTKRWLDYQDVAVELDPATGRFLAVPRFSAPPVLGPQFKGFDGRFAVSDHHVFTAVTIAGAAVG
jgi:4'-phosphopantetheinyl transferase EntD